MRFEECGISEASWAARGAWHTVRLASCLSCSCHRRRCPQAVCGAGAPHPGTRCLDLPAAGGERAGAHAQVWCIAGAVVRKRAAGTRATRLTNNRLNAWAPAFPQLCPATAWFTETSSPQTCCWTSAACSKLRVRGAAAGCCWALGLGWALRALGPPRHLGSSARHACCRPPASARLHHHADLGIARVVDPQACERAVMVGTPPRIREGLAWACLGGRQRINRVAPARVVGHHPSPAACHLHLFLHRRSAPAGSWRLSSTTKSARPPPPTSTLSASLSSSCVRCARRWALPQPPAKLQRTRRRHGGARATPLRRPPAWRGATLQSCCACCRPCCR